MKNFKFFYFFLFFLLFAFEVKAELTFEYHVGVRPIAQTSIIDADGDAINRDLLEDPTGIAFSSDGLKAFTTNKKGDDDKGKCVTETTLTVPYDFRQAHTQTDRSDVLRNAGETVANNLKCEDIKFSHDGLRMLISSSAGFIPVSYTHLTLPTKRIV